MSNTTKVTVLYGGYSTDVAEGMIANCSCVLITGQKNVIVDTMTAWDSENLKTKLKELNLECNDINYVVCTHGHSDHVGCNHLFLNAVHIVGFSISHKNLYYNFNFHAGHEYKIGDFIKVIPTPGHTLQDVSVVVDTCDMGTVAIAGDLFENEDDLNDDLIWIAAGSDDPDLQRQNRERILSLADWIVPGHGQMFKVNKS